MLRQRLLTALVLLPLAIAAVLALRSEWFALVLAGVMVVGAWEWSALAGFRAAPARVGYVLGTLALMLLAYVLARDDVPVLLSLLGAASLGWLLAAYWIVRYPAATELWARGPWVRSLMGFVALAVCWLALFSLHERLANGPLWVLYLLALMWIADSGAYLAGRQWGRRKLAPQVSPGKTWEGAWGGLLGVVAATAGLAWHLELALAPALALVGLAVVCAVFSIVGDLTESLLKRQAGVKDSGQLLPGHGGMLDRIDSLLAAAPLFVLGMAVLGWLQ